MAPLPPYDLKCERLKDPLGVDTAKPRFSWILESPARGDEQTGFHIIVSSDRQLAESTIGNFWDSGLMDGDRNSDIDYGGEPLQTCARYFWRVRWRAIDGGVSPWSDIASFVTGFLNEGDWKPRWISAMKIREFQSGGSVLLGEPGAPHVQAHAVYLRKEFKVREKPALALVFIAGLGVYEFRLNGEKIGDRVLDPGWTDYNKRALYSTYDITDLLQTKNAAAVILGNGRHVKNYGYDMPKLACRIEIEYESGGRDIIFSDDSWKTSHGPLQENGLYFGEKYDARLEMPAWDMPKFRDKTWDKAVRVQGPPLFSQMMEPIRVAETLTPKKVWRLQSGAWIFDFGQNFSGWVRLNVEGPAGTEIRLRHAELVNPDGTLNMGSIENAEATDIYILNGSGPEAYEPRFTYHGFRYVELSGFPGGEPPQGTLKGRFVHSDVGRTGTFACSDPLINKIHENVLWGQLSNLMSIPTDCPQRDERHGWLGDAHLSAEEAIYNFDMAAFYVKFLEDIRLAQKDDGSLPDVVPPYLPRLYPADPAWSSAYVTIIWSVYEHYADARVLARHYPYLKKYIDFLGRNAAGSIIKDLGKYGDWCPPGSIVPKKTPVSLTSTWFYYHDVLRLSQIARVLARPEEAKTYEKLAAEILLGFNSAYLEDEQYAAIRVSKIDNYPNQTSNVLPLYLNMPPPEKKDKVLGSLVRSVVRHQDFHVDTGILGTRYILDVLTENGLAETALSLATQKSYPGWGYMVEEGATTLWERWEKLTGSAMNSQNHIMLGSVDAWFYRTIAGLKPLEPGWKTVGFKPHLLGNLRSAEAMLSTVRGPVRSAWTRETDLLNLEIDIPVGSKARIHVPVPWPGCRVEESGKIIWHGGLSVESGPDLSFDGNESSYAIFKARSGRYRFKVKKVR